MPTTHEHARNEVLQEISHTELREAVRLVVWWQMLLGTAAMPAVSRTYGVEVYQPAAPAGNDGAAFSPLRHLVRLVAENGSGIAAES